MASILVAVSLSGEGHRHLLETERSMRIRLRSAGTAAIARYSMR